jgi:hypothetical protein
MLGLACSTMVNLVNSIYAKKGEKPKHVDPSVFIPKWYDDSKKDDKVEPVEQTEAEQLEAMRSIFQAFGKKTTAKLKPPPVKKRST